jgi:hypothetical protein
MNGRLGGLGALTACLVMGLSGCCTARFISVDADYAVVAIPNNTNDWPTYNRTHAEELMHQKFPQGFVIDHEGEVVTGTTQHTNTNTETKGDQLLAALKVSPIEQQTHQTTSFENKTEWRIWVRATGAPPRPEGPPEGVQPVGKPMAVVPDAPPGPSPDQGN